MSNIAERYTHLCRSYVKLSDQFQKLDVDHMTLKSKVVPLLKSLRTHQSVVSQLQQENLQLTQQLQQLMTQYEALKPLEIFLQPDLQAALSEAEEQALLVEQTLQEIAEDRDPDLSESEKALLAEYQQTPQAFELPRFDPPSLAQYHSDSPTRSILTAAP
jgi:predicted  nucleic acid-binding Zn-ribbon protein